MLDQPTRLRRDAAGGPRDSLIEIIGEVVVESTGAAPIEGRPKPRMKRRETPPTVIAKSGKTVEAYFDDLVAQRIAEGYEIVDTNGSIRTLSIVSQDVVSSGLHEMMIAAGARIVDATHYQCVGVTLTITTNNGDACDITAAVPESKAAEVAGVFWCAGGNIIATWSNNEAVDLPKLVRDGARTSRLSESLTKALEAAGKIKPVIDMVKATASSRRSKLTMTM